MPAHQKRGPMRRPQWIDGYQQEIKMTSRLHQLSPPLDEYQRQYEALREEARSMAGGLDREQINWAPAPEKWSIGQCLVHLNAVDRAYAKALERGISAAHDKGMIGGGRIRYNWLERWFIRSMEPPPKRRFSAPAKVAPAEDHDPEEIVKTFVETKDRLIDLLQRSDDLDVCRVKIVSPISKFLKLRLGAAFAVIAAHDRRHLWQARQVRQYNGFPDR